MFGRKEDRAATTKPRAAADDGNPWDRATLDKIGAGDRINLQLTHLEIRRRFGARPSRDFEHGTFELIGTGFVPQLDQHVHAQLTFEHVRDHFGVAVFDYQLNEKYQGINVHLPVLHVVLNDADGAIATALREGMRDTLIAGESGLEVRCWCSFPPGWLHGKDIRCPITGFNIWSNLSSPSIAGWQRPVGDNDLSDIPDATTLRSHQDR